MAAAPTTGWRAYPALLRSPGVLRVVPAYVATRFAVNMILLASFLMVRAETGSFVAAGLSTAGYGVAVAVAGPLVGRLVDRIGQRRVLVGSGLGYPLLLLGLATAAAARAPLPVLMLTASLAGASAPPVAPCLRALWPVLAGDADRRRTAFTLESILLEASFVLAPALVAALMAVWSATAATLMAAAVASLGTLVFSTAPASRTWRGLALERHWSGPLVAPGVRWLLGTQVAVALGFGLLEVAVSGFAVGAGRPALTGLLISLWCAGSLAGGLCYGARAGRRPAAEALPRLLLVVTIGALPLGLVRSPLALAAVLLLGSLAIAPSMSAQLELYAAEAPAGTTTEAFTWATTANYGGTAAGTALGGAVVAGVGVSATFGLSAAGLLVAAATSLGVRARLRRPAEPVGRATARDATSATGPATRPVPASVGG